MLHPGPCLQAMSGDDYVLTWEDVLYMQLLLQHFDAQKSINGDCGDQALRTRSEAPAPQLLLSVDPGTIGLLRARLQVGHVRGPGDPKKRPPKPRAVAAPAEDGAREDSLSVANPMTKPPQAQALSKTSPTASAKEATAKAKGATRRPSGTKIPNL